MSATTLETVCHRTDVLVIGGGTAGCAAAWLLAGKGLRVTVMEKAAVDRSGCLAAGVNAINAWTGPGKGPADYVEYALADAHGIGSRELLLTMAERLGEAALFLERLGVPFHRNPDGSWASRSWRNLKINGGDIKPLLAACIKGRPAVTVLERVHALSLIAAPAPGASPGVRRVVGCVGLRLDRPELVTVEAGAVVCAAGGAAGIYRPNNPGLSGHKMWYPPFNTGGGWAMGILAGAEMTTLEMRFVALRLQDTAAPTGTLAVGQGARQENALGEDYEYRYGNTTSQRVLAWRRETEAGRGPCVMRAGYLGGPARRAIVRSYLHMSPLQALRFLEGEAALADGGEGEAPRDTAVQIEGTEPYVIGGHTASGLQVDAARATTLPGLFACGDAAGGAPQKYVSGAIAEGWIAAESAAALLAASGGARIAAAPGGHQGAGGGDAGPAAGEAAEAVRSLAERFLSGPGPVYSEADLEEAMQKAMDAYAGGRGSGYRYGLPGLREAEARILGIWRLSGALRADTLKGLSKIWELRERLVVARSLVAHLAERRETRWPGFGEYAEHPGEDERELSFVNSRLADPPLLPPEDLADHPPVTLRRSLADGRVLPAPGGGRGATRCP
ncbi:MAG: adenylyl-sulfate reductase subunit alpha [Deltaproteobacteria bacterium]|jgi:adenylylsulfate reductase subunit A|nr:adenylyl-sulfate reductase subunit alpha [Deltaproteobacteria bacterium]